MAINYFALCVAPLDSSSKLANLVVGVLHNMMKSEEWKMLKVNSL